MQNGPTFEASAAPGRLLIIDGHAYAYRAFFAIRSLSSPAGQATNAIYGFIRMLAKVRDRVRPSHAMVIWDGGLARERMTLLPEYKAQRPEMPPICDSNWMGSWPICTRQTSFPISRNLAKPMIASHRWRARRRKGAWKSSLPVRTRISCNWFAPKSNCSIRMINRTRLWGAEEVERKTGVEPTQIVDWLSLVGDSVDNIPGVPGVGPKTAADLLRKFGSS